MSEPVLEIEQLTVCFGANRVVDGISLMVRSGECVALVGESGSGKSVTARSVLGLAGDGARVRAERLRVDGVDVLTATRRQLARLRGGSVGTISQDALVALDPLRLVGREVEDALRLHTRLNPVERRRRVLELLAEAGIPDPEVRAAQRSDELSGGLRQRALIAAAIAASPRLLIADEPTTALDREVRDGVLDLVRAQTAAGAGVLLITHDLEVVRRIADRVLVMTEGRVVEDGTVEAVLGAPQHPYTRRLLAASPVGKARFEPLSAPADAASAASAASARSAAPAPSAASSPAPAHSAASALSPDSAPSAASAPSTGSSTAPTTADAPSDATRSQSQRRAPAAAPALAATDLSLSFDGPDGTHRKVLDSLSFTLPVGRTLGLVGPSGSGKTSIARIALGLQRADSGEIRLLGDPWTTLPERERRPRRGTIGAVYQDPLGSFDPRLTVGRILADAATAGRHRSSPEVPRLLDAVGLAAELAGRRPRHLSGGQRQRVAIARALAGDPQVLVLDEPVASLDVSIQAQVLDLLDALQLERGLSYLFISHDADVISHMSDEVLTLRPEAADTDAAPSKLGR